MSNKFWYLTFGEGYSGVYDSQVIDFISYFNAEKNLDMRLISYLSLRNFFKEKNTIRRRISKSTILPMFPGFKKWERNLFLLKVIAGFAKPDAIVARGPFAANLALRLRNAGLTKRVVYDGRGAVAAEWEEYDFGQSNDMVPLISSLEREAVLKSDYRLGVSNALVKYWESRFNYKDAKHSVIPCLLSTNFINNAKEAISKRDTLRKELGYGDNKKVLVFAGGTGGWQSSADLVNLIKDIFVSDSDTQLLLLSKSSETFNDLMSQYPDRVKQFWLKPEQVPFYMAAADYGLLLREHSVTNSVASPTKFAEYLACGLKVLISDELGDYSSFTVEKACGYLIKGSFLPTIALYDNVERERIINLSVNNFHREAYADEYSRLMNVLGV